MVVEWDFMGYLGDNGIYVMEVSWGYYDCLSGFIGIILGKYWDIDGYDLLVN